MADESVKGIATQNVDQGEISIKFAYSLAANSNEMTSLTALDVGRDSDLNRNTPISSNFFFPITWPLFLIRKLG
jgi:hypothetical protein